MWWGPLTAMNPANSPSSVAAWTSSAARLQRIRLCEAVCVAIEEMST